MTELQNMTFREVEICGGQRTKNGLEIAMWNKGKCGLSVCTGVLGVGKIKVAWHKRAMSSSGKNSVRTAHREDSGNWQCFPAGIVGRFERACAWAHVFHLK